MVLLLMIVTVLLYIVVLLRYIKWVPVFGFLAVIAHLAVILRLISSSMDSTAKVTWMLMIILFPFFSVFLYIYFKRLMESGVKIYTYTPGFVHAKVFVSDDCKACLHLHPRGQHVSPT